MSNVSTTFTYGGTGGGTIGQYIDNGWLYGPPSIRPPLDLKRYDEIDRHLRDLGLDFSKVSLVPDTLPDRMEVKRPDVLKAFE